MRVYEYVEFDKYDFWRKEGEVAPPTPYRLCSYALSHMPTAYYIRSYALWPMILRSIAYAPTPYRLCSYVLCAMLLHLTPCMA
eukprot:776712-Rhodomonas_salina.2